VTNIANKAPTSIIEAIGLAHDEFRPENLKNDENEKPRNGVNNQLGELE
jgi:hypothetical protein